MKRYGSGWDEDRPTLKAMMAAYAFGTPDEAEAALGDAVARFGFMGDVDIARSAAWLTSDTYLQVKPKQNPSKLKLAPVAPPPIKKPRPKPAKPQQPRPPSGRRYALSTKIMSERLGVDEAGLEAFMTARAQFADRLPEDEARALELYFGQRLSVAGIARTLGYTPPKANRHLENGIRNIRLAERGELLRLPAKNGQRLTDRFYDERGKVHQQRDLLEQLPPEQNDVLCMYLFDELRRRDIATILGLKTTQVQQILLRARTNFRRLTRGDGLSKNPTMWQQQYQDDRRLVQAIPDLSDLLGEDRWQLIAAYYLVDEQPTKRALAEQFGTDVMSVRLAIASRTQELRTKYDEANS
jgi:DNA-directed RNA polymerase specialized sigma24 family protein